MSSLADQDIDPRLAKLQAGEPLVFPAPPTDREETPEEIAARTIPAKWLKDLAVGHARVVSVPVVISNAIIDGPLDLEYATFECGLSITGTTFKDAAGFSFAVFKRGAEFDRSKLEKPARFRAAHAEADFDILYASFADGSSFQDLHVNEVLNATGARFGEVNFERIEISKDAFFRSDAQGRRVTFGDKTSFHSAHIHGNAEFNGAEFMGEAAFDGIQVDGGAFFRSDDKGQRVTFGGEARFHGAHIHGNADFRGAEFQAETFFLGAHIRGDASFSGAEFKAKAAFDRIQVDGGAFFRSDDQQQRVTFGGEARFHGAHIQGVADFRGVEFKAKAAFDGIEVDGGAFFRGDDRGQRVTFGGVASFPSAVFQSDAQFTGVEFKRRTDFDNAQFHGAADFNRAEFSSGSEATFIGAHFERGAYFDSAKFGGATDFTSAAGSRDVSFLDTEFSGPVSFREASFQVILFGKPSQETPGVRATTKRPTLSEPARFEVERSVDLRGLTYDRIYVDLDELFPKIATTDRQPYTQLEQALRKVGDDARANKVYLERRRVERKRMFSEGPMFSGSRLRWALDCFYLGAANYGIRPYRLIGYALLFLFLGTWSFSPPGAVKLKDDKKVAAAMSDLAGYNVARALGVSVHQFLPIDVPVGSDWVPASRGISIPVQIRRWKVSIPVWPSVCGTLLRIAGAILVGIGLGSVTGLLRRVSP